MGDSDIDSGGYSIHRPEGLYSIQLADGLPRLDERQFNPSGYTQAEPVLGKGGRGHAWFVHIDGMPAVLKHYRRGGWAAKLSTDWYFGPRAADARSFREMCLLQQLLAEGLPVPKPLAAFRLGRSGFYRAAILTGRILGARSLVEVVKAGDAPWAAVGEALARCHAAHARHADLNANNILLDPAGKVWLIDWDKGAVDPRDNVWQARVIDRLVRSLRKECMGDAGGRLDAGIAELRRAYRMAPP